LRAINYLKNIILETLLEKSKRQQSTNELQDVGLWDLRQNASGHMAVGNHDIVALVEEYGSPLFVVNHARLVKDIHRTQLALEKLDTEAKLLYSYKTNCIPGILKVMHDEGIGAEVISHYELWVANKMNVPGDSIVFNGVNKTDESLKMAIDMDILSINVDDMNEIERIYRIAGEMKKKARVGVRLGLVQKSQFGVEVTSGAAMEACKKIIRLSDRLELHCVHFNVTSNAKNAKTHIYHAQKAIEFMHQVQSTTGHFIPYLDIGGGFGVATTKNMSSSEYGIYRLFGCLPRPPALAEYQPFASFISDINDSVKEQCSKLGYGRPKIILEPGRLITSSAQMLLTKINSIKKKSDGTVFVITDTGRLSTTFPCDFEYHEMFVANRPKDKKCQFYNIVGRVCTSADWLMKNRFLPELNDKDILAVMDAGAYFSSYSTNFAFQRPAIIIVDGDSVTLLRKNETFEHLIAMDTIVAIKKDKDDWV
jgi:diaminopimelate decarboxylase